ncbi:hypothetical protein DAI22_09g083100 [Oryza sativa Japonica Group]|nr:hypothetical protein DAI22_09g083100 [Oryza sativa Japonica Group]
MLAIVMVAVGLMFTASFCKEWEIMLIMPITWMNKRKSSGSAPSPLFLGTRPKRLRSKVWDDFKPIYIDGKVARAECMHCHQILISNSANGTSNLLKHQAKCSPHPQKRPMQQKLPFLLSSQKSLTAPNSDPTQKKLPFLPISQKKCSGPADAMPQKKDPALPNSMNDTNWKSQEVGKSGSPEELATPEQKNLALPDVPTNNNRKDQPHDENLVPKQKCNPTVVNLKNPEVDQSGSNGLIQTMAMCGYLPMMMYNNRFRKCVPCLNSMLPMPSNDSMFGDFMQLFHNEKAKLKEKFSTLSSRVCLSAHVWHHDPLSAYLCLSVHYIDNEWERQQKIIRFRQVDPSCNARELSDVILRAIEDWGLRDKVFSITLDDEFADDSVASNVKDHLQKWNSHYSNQSLFVVRYGTYLLDQVIQVGLDELDKSMEKSMKCSKFTEGFTSSAVRKANHNYAESAKDWSNARPICDTLESFHQYMDTMHDFPRPRHLFDKVEDTNSTSETRNEVGVNRDDDRLKYYHQHQSEISICERPMTELDQYLLEPRLSKGEPDVLRWWKGHNLTYPTVARMARDILAMPCRTNCNVAIRTAKFAKCESRSSHDIEELVCLQDWLTPDGFKYEKNAQTTTCSDNFGHYAKLIVVFVTDGVLLWFTRLKYISLSLLIPLGEQRSPLSSETKPLDGHRSTWSSSAHWYG